MNVGSCGAELLQRLVPDRVAILKEFNECGELGLRYEHISVQESQFSKSSMNVGRAPRSTPIKLSPYRQFSKAKQKKGFFHKATRCIGHFSYR
ncbi:MAG: hypothetical protein SFU91_11495 [Chloroherpetonaceae bacterium]|nr:hypothetical protein [Chloroherpetonaceae bacterium]